MHSLSSTQTLGLRPVISPEQHTSQKSVLLFLSAYAQNPSSAPHRKSSRATEPLNLGALPRSASRSHSCRHTFTTTSCCCRTVCSQSWCIISPSFKGIVRPRGYVTRLPLSLWCRPCWRALDRSSGVYQSLKKFHSVTTDGNRRL